MYMTEVAKIRQELRERLMGQRHHGVAPVLASLRRFVERGEYERWRLRFEALAATA